MGENGRSKFKYLALGPSLSDEENRRLEVMSKEVDFSLLSFVIAKVFNGV